MRWGGAGLGGLHARHDQLKSHVVLGDQLESYVAQVHVTRVQVGWGGVGWGWAGLVCLIRQT